MRGIHVMAAVTVVVGAAVWGGTLRAFAGRRREPLLAAVVALPLSAAVNLLVKGPIGRGLAGAAGDQPSIRPDTALWLVAALFLLAPVFEEAVKLAPLALRRVRRRAADLQGALWTGMAIGVGFGLGEAAYLAWRLGRSPDYADEPWWAFTGFFTERLSACFVHGVLTAIVVTGLARGGRSALLGYLTAAGLHAVANLGPLLVGLELLQPAAAFALLFPTVFGLALLFERLRRAAGRAAGPRQPRAVLYEQHRG